MNERITQPLWKNVAQATYKDLRPGTMVVGPTQSNAASQLRKMMNIPTPIQVIKQEQSGFTPQSTYDSIARLRNKQDPYYNNNKAELQAFRNKVSSISLNNLNTTVFNKIKKVGR
jgi:hypothetical protein